MFNMYYIKRQVNILKGDMILETIKLDQLRRKSNVLVIDDDEFIPLEGLKNHGYYIQQKNDIQNLKDVEPYDIILCDIRGVGKFLKSAYEGAYLAKQIKETYPSKIVLVYTADNYKADFEKYLKYADSIISKGMDIEDWSSILDANLRDSVNPVVQWEKVRDALLKAGVTTIEVAQLEDKYVKSIQDKNFSTLKSMSEKEQSVIAKIMKSLIESIIVKVITGGLV